jgi:hypothetical protein
MRDLPVAAGLPTPGALLVFPAGFPAWRRGDVRRLRTERVIQEASRATMR